MSARLQASLDNAAIRVQETLPRSEVTAWHRPGRPRVDTHPTEDKALWGRKPDEYPVGLGEGGGRRDRADALA